MHGKMASLNRFQRSSHTLTRLAPLDDKQHIPIQVADLLAYATTKVYEKVPSGGPPDRIAAHRELKQRLCDNLVMGRYCNANYLRKVVAANAEVVKVSCPAHPDGKV
jgi:hypothetical protein